VGATRAGFTEIEQENFAPLACREGVDALGRERGAVPRGVEAVAETELAADDVEPGAPPERELVDDVLTAGEQGRIDDHVLLEPK
jgi:hypothetical protein